MKQVEHLAQGKIWTGWEARNNGLVDEVGGLDRAIAFAIRNYTSGEAEVERWPKPETLGEQLWRKALSFFRDPDLLPTMPASVSEYDAAKFLVQTIINDPGKVESMQLGGMCFAMDEGCAIAHLVASSAEKLQTPLLHPSIWSSKVKD